MESRTLILAVSCNRSRRAATIALALLIAVLGVERQARANACLWNKSTAASWSTAGNWTSCGSTTPQPADTVTFSNGASQKGSCNIDVSATVTSISIASGYTGTVTQNAGIAVTATAGFTQVAGTFAGGTGALTIGTDFSQSAGTFTGSSGTITVSGNFALSGTAAFTASSGLLAVGTFSETGSATFSPNGGRLMLTGPSGSKTFASNGEGFTDLVVNDGLMGYWKLDETSTPSLDSSGYGRNATWSSTPSSAAAAPVNFTNGGSLNFDSAADYATFTTPDLPVITIAAWVKATAAGGGTYQRILEQPAYTLFINGATLSAPDNPMSLAFTSNRVSSGVGEWKSPSNSLTYGTWYHVAVTYDSSSTANDPVLYINGVAQTVTEKTTPAGAAIGNAGNAYIGNRSGADRYLNGMVDDLRIYNRALSASEIAALAGGDQPSTGLSTQGLTGNPSISGNLIIASGTLSAANTTVTVGGNWWNYGGIFSTGTTGGVTFNGSGSSKILSSGWAFNDLTLSGTGTWTVADSVLMTIGRDFVQSNGTFGSTAGTLEIQRAFNKTGGTFTANSGKVLLSSPTSQTFTTNGATFYNLTINDGLTGYWKLDEGSGTTAADSSGYGNTGTLQNGPTWLTSGLPTLTFSNPSAVSLDGTNDVVDLGPSVAPTTGNYSVCAWVKMTSVTGYRTFVSVDGTAVSGFYLQKRSDTGLFSLSVPANDSNGAAGVNTSSTTTPVANTWYHLCGTYDGANLRLYVNGSLQGTTAFSTPWAATGHVIIGGGLYNGARTDFTAGYVDEVRMYKRTLAATEISALANGTRPAGVATQTLGGNLTVAGALSIDSGTLATSSYTVAATGAASVSGGLTVGSNTLTLSGGLVQQAQGTVTENTAGGHIVLATGQATTYDDTDGAVQGFPTAAFDWSTFAYWNTYVAFRDYSGTTDRLFARSADGAPKYYWDLPAGVGDLVGTPRWNMEGSTHYVYLVTTLGRVYKLSDDGTAFAVVSGWPYFNGSSATATSPLVADANNLYWCGNDSTGARQMFSLALATKVLNGTRALTGDVVAAPALATISAINYLFTATSGKVYRALTTLASDINSTQPTTTVNGRLSVFGGNVMFPEDNGKVWALSSTTLATTWSYQDTNTTRHPGTPTCSAGNQCSVAAFYYDSPLSRTYFGDQDGHLYVLNSSGTSLTGYPWRPGLSTDSFLTAPLYRSGVILIGSSSGKVFVIDQNNGTGPALTRTYTLGAAVSSISFNSNAGTSGGYAVATTNGQLYYLANEIDPTSGNI